MTRPYSRLSRIQEKRHVRSAFLFGSLTILFGVFLVFFGIPLTARFSSFVANLRGSTKIIENSDNIPPGPPSFTTFPETTSSQSVTIEGTSEPGVVVTIEVNGIKKEVIANSFGQFSLKTDLQKGINTIFAYATDTAGNKSVETKKYEVIFDNEIPELEISKPKEDDSFFGKNSQKIKIEGKTKAGAMVTINGRFVNTNSDGSFSYEFNLSDGDNPLTIKSIDKAGNEVEKTIKVNYSS